MKETKISLTHLKILKILLNHRFYNLRIAKSKHKIKVNEKINKKREEKMKELK